jgi:hypothetical protein
MYEEFQPTLFENNSYIHYKIMPEDQVFYKNLEIVLNYNNVDYKIDDKGRILVKRNLNSDKDLLLNYTKKALDTIWLNSHREPK